MTAVPPRSVRTPSAPDGARARIRPRVRITFEGTVFTWFALLFALAALAFEENLVLLLGLVAFTAAQAARWLAGRNVAGLVVERDVPARARARAPVPVTLTLRNPRRRPAVGLEVEDRPGPGVRPASLVLDVAGIPSGESVRHTTRMVFGRRGRRRLGALEVRSRYPLGFFRAEASLPASDSILVRPAQGRPTRMLRSWMGGASESQRRPSLVTRGDDALHGIREFQEGDDPRRIHWRTTARRGALTVAEWRREKGREVLVILGRSGGAGRASRVAFERAVSVAATIWRAAGREGLEAHLDLGRPGRVPYDVRRRLGSGLDALALVQPQGGRRPRGALRRHAARRSARFVVYVASGPERGIRPRLAQTAGRGGRFLLLRADQPSVRRWVEGV